MNLWALGPGESTLNYRQSLEEIKNRNLETIFFQSVFPWGYKFYNIVPTFWTWSDPNAALEGLEFLKNLDSTNPDYEKFQKMLIIIPHFLADTYQTFRRFSGTSALKGQKWSQYLNLINEIKRKKFNIWIIDANTVKNDALSSFKSQPAPDYCDLGFESRFSESCDLIFGTAAFDSETVIGMKYKWGLENKVSSSIFPIAQFLGTKELYVMGFDFVGKRFYDYGIDSASWGKKTGQHGYVAGRHAANSKPQLEVALGYVKKWIDTTKIHGMKIYSTIEDKYTLINSVVPYKSFADILKEGK